MGFTVASQYMPNTHIILNVMSEMGEFTKSLTIRDKAVINVNKHRDILGLFCT